MPKEKQTPPEEGKEGEPQIPDRRQFCKHLVALAALFGAKVIGCGGRAIGMPEDREAGVEAGVEGCDAGEGCEAGPEEAEPEEHEPEGAEPEEHEPEEHEPEEEEPEK